MFILVLDAKKGLYAAQSSLHNLIREQEKLELLERQNKLDSGQSTLSKTNSIYLECISKEQVTILVGFSFGSSYLFIFAPPSLPASPSTKHLARLGSPL